MDSVEPAVAVWDDAAFEPSADGWLRARVSRGSAGWRATLTGRRGEVEFAFDPAAGWRVTDGAPAVAASGGFETPYRLVLDVAFLETPHRLHVTLEPSATADSGTATGTWRCAPLSDPADLSVLTAPGRLR